ncbi:unnamed protein product [Chrysoparadoxa australica]
MAVPNEARARPVHGPEFIRTQYLSNLGIWTKERANARRNAKLQGFKAKAKAKLAADNAAKSSSPKADASPSSGTSTQPASPRSDLVAPKSPVKRHVEPPRRDIRRHYLSNLGIAKPGQAPPLLRKVSSNRDLSQATVHEEKLKDQKSEELSLEDLVRMVGPILGSLMGASTSKASAEKEKELADLCDRCKARKPADGETIVCNHKHIRFNETVSVIYVPVHFEYSNRVRQSYWASAGEIREMVYRNMLEFDAEGYQWEQVAEEEDMYYCNETGEYIHPVFFDSDEEATEVEDARDEELLSDSKPLPKQMERRWAS